MSVCANWICTKELTEYEETRLTAKFNKWRLCATCRRNPHIRQIKCPCGKPTEHTGQKLYCPECTTERYKERQRIAQRRRNERKKEN